MSAMRSRGYLLGALVLGALAVLAVVWALTASVPPTPVVPLGTPGLVIGITANLLDSAPALGPVVRKAGIGWLREEFRWDLIEPRRGRFDYRRYDALVGDAARRGERLLPLLVDSPPWLARAPLTIPRDLASWQRFVAGVVGRYGPRGEFWRANPQLDARLAPRVWEIWNEPYLPQFSAGGVSPAAYADLVAASVQAGRRVDPESRWLTAAETKYRSAGGAARSWLPDLLAARPDLGRYLDLLAVHPYSLVGPEEEKGDVAGRFDRIAEIATTMENLGLSDPTLWLTELGWSTCTQRPPCVAETVQARYLRQALQRIASRYRGLVAAVFVYRFSDLQGNGPGDFLARFGVVRRNGKPKPAYEVVRQAAQESR